MCVHRLCLRRAPQKGINIRSGSRIVPEQTLGRCRLSRAVDDAVYLDEDAYHQVQPKVAYLKTIQVRHDAPHMQLQLMLR